MATVRIQLRRGTAAQWTSANPTLAAGEIGLESDTRKIKFGDGSTTWSSLSYLNPGDIDELTQDAMNAALTMGTGLTKVYDDNANTITLSVDTSIVATRSYVDTAVSNLVDGAPAVLDTLNEIAAAIDNDESFSSTIMTNLSLKAPKASPTFTGNPTSPTPVVGSNDNTIATTKFVKDQGYADNTQLQNTKTDVSNLQGSVSTIQGNISNLQSDVSTLNTDVSTAQGDILNLQSDVSTLNTDMSNAQGDISNAQGDITTIQTDLSTLTSDFNNHDTKTTSVHGITDTSALEIGRAHV